jgi:hypothetical protein
MSVPTYMCVCTSYRYEDCIYRAPHVRTCTVQQQQLTQSTEQQSTQSTVDTEHRAAVNTEHRAQSTEHSRVQSTEHRVQSTPTTVACHASPRDGCEGVLGRADAHGQLHGRRPQQLSKHGMAVRQGPPRQLALHTYSVRTSCHVVHVVHVVSCMSCMSCRACRAWRIGPRETQSAVTQPD